MDWEYIKDKVLVFGEDDYVFSDMIISILKEFDKVVDKETTKIYTFILMKELMKERLVEIFLVEDMKLKNLPFKSNIEIDNIISIIEKKMEIANYEFQPDSLYFCIMTSKKGSNYIKRNNSKG